MTDQGAVPPNFWQHIDRRIDQKVAAYMRATAIRTATLFDQTGSVVFSDDDVSGQGIARPYLAIPLYPTAFANFVGTTSTAFVDLYGGTSYKQQPRAYVRVMAGNDTSGATGEVRVMVNGVQLGATASTGFSVAAYDFGPLPVDGANMDPLVVSVQARMVSGTGSVKVSPATSTGFQS